MSLSKNIYDNIALLESTFPVGKSFDILTRHLTLGDTKAYWLGINGLTKSDILQQIFALLQYPLYTKDTTIEDIQLYVNAKIGYCQAELSEDFPSITKSILSGCSVLVVDGFSTFLILDTRSYPQRSISEPDTEKVLRGAKDGFTETLVQNTALVRRRIRNPKLTFEIHEIGADSKTDVSIAFIDGIVDTTLLNALRDRLSSLNVTSLTMGSKSLEELIIRKKWFNPLPSIYMTERPDVACSYLLEGYIVVIVDNSPAVLVLPCTIFQFTQSPEDYYKNPSTGNYFRFIRFGCIFISLFLMPLFLLITNYYNNIGKIRLFVFVLFVEVGLDIFKYSSSHASSSFSNSMSIIGGLIISDIAIELKWTNLEAIFYGAITLLSTLSLASVEFGEGIRIYRIILVLAAGFGQIPGFIIASVAVFISIITTPTFARSSYLWPLFPFNKEALMTLLFRYPTAKAQPSKRW